MPITAVFKCVCPAMLASESSLTIFCLCPKFPKVTDQPLNPLHLPCGLWSGLAVVPVCNQLLCVLMVAVTPRFSSKGVLFCLLYCYNHRYFSLTLDRIPFNRILACVISSRYLLGRGRLSFLD